MNTTTRLVVTCAALLLGSLAQAAPDFSGTWVLNAQKGKNLGMVAAVKETVVISQTADRLSADFSSTFMGNTTRRQVSYDLTGKGVVNEGAMGDKADTVAKFDGDKLVVSWTSEGAVAGTKTVKTETRWLSPDGRTMTVVNARPNKDPMEMVYEKQ
ncbi:MAG: hypothetical protein QY320_14715 [Gammaproteobacteria bacterium]|nr:MAG: hypothetical protein QY320_14715 [Gammaproteobacteria bacterium]